MKLSDLQLKDWIQTKESGSKVQVDIKFIRNVLMVRENEGIDLIEQNYQPILLTNEILEKNFPRYFDDEYYDFYEYNEGLSQVVMSREPASSKDGPWSFGYGRKEDEDSWFRDYVSEFSITYVHELQHLLRICGIKKEIVV